MVEKIRQISKRGLDLIKTFEGFAEKVYVCPAGYKTIGFGHVLRAGESFPEPLTVAQAEDILVKDIHSAEQAVHRLIYPKLTQGQYDALVSFTFNLGSGALQRSTLRRKVNREEHDDVPQEFIKWIWAGGRKVNGLLRRRAAEARLYDA